MEVLVFIQSMIDFFKKHIYYISPSQEMRSDKNYKKKRISVALFFLLGGLLGVMLYLINPQDFIALAASLAMVFIGLVYLLFLLHL